MTSPIKKTPIEEYFNTMDTILKYIDKSFKIIKSRQKNLPAWKGYDNFGHFLKEIEKDALKNACEELKIADTTIRDRWKVLSLPFPAYSALEKNEITFSKAKLMTVINFDFNNPKDEAVAQEIVDAIKEGKSDKEIKEFIQKKSREVWNKSDISMQNIAKQHGITKDTKC